MSVSSCVFVFVCRSVRECAQWTSTKLPDKQQCREMSAIPIVYFIVISDAFDAARFMLPSCITIDIRPNEITASTEVKLSACIHTNMSKVKHAILSEINWIRFGAISECNAHINANNRRCAFAQTQQRQTSMCLTIILQIFYIRTIFYEAIFILMSRHNLCSNAIGYLAAWRMHCCSAVELDYNGCCDFIHNNKFPSIRPCLGISNSRFINININNEVKCTYSVGVGFFCFVLFCPDIYWNGEIMAYEWRYTRHVCESWNGAIK